MQFADTPEQTQLRDAIDKFVLDRYGDNQRREYRSESSGYSEDNWRDLAAMGLFGLPFSTADGGLGWGPRELTTVMDALGRGFVAEPMLEQIVLAGGVLAGVGDPGQKATWLPRLISGETQIGLAHFEHGARFNLTRVNLRATRRAGHVCLDGEKSLVPLAAASEQWIVSAREHGNPTDPDGIAFYLVPADSPGIERRDFHLADGSIASAVRFADAVAGERLRGGYAEFAAALDTARLAAGAEMVGIMTTLLNSTVEYLRTRTQFGAPLASFQALQHRLADLYVSLEQSRSQVYRAVVCIESGVGRERSVAAMKSYVSRAAIDMGEECVHLHGGIGTTDDLAIGHGYKRLLVLASLFGDADAELVRFLRLAG